MPADRPNILLITTDQQRWDTLSVYGQPGYRTPHLDDLANQGVCFDRTYCPAPICTPTRVSILTGQHSSRHGSFTIGVEPSPALDGPTLGRLLGAAGYDTALIGKTHFVARGIEHQHVAGHKHPTPETPLPDEDFWAGFDGPYLGFDFVRHCQSHTCDRAPNAHYRAWLNRKGLNLDDLHNDRQTGRRVPDGAWAIDPEHTQTAWITEESIDWIRNRRDADRPWLCWVSHQDPHPPFVCPEPYFSDVDMTGVDLGGMKDGEFDDKPACLRNFAHGKYWVEDDGTKLWDGINVPAVQVDKGGDPAPKIQAYIGMCNMVDDYVGRLLRALDEAGELDNTLIIFTSDHGEMLNRHGLWQKGPAPYDDCQRVPGLIRWAAGQAGPTGRRDAFFNLVDILPTCLDAAGVDVPPGVQGVSQLPALRGEVHSVQDYALVDLIATVNFHQQTLVHDGWKLVTYRHTAEAELYDLTEDPDQYRNRFDDPAAADVRQRMLQRLVQANMEAAGVLPTRIANA